MTAKTAAEMAAKSRADRSNDSTMETTTGRAALMERAAKMTKDTVVTTKPVTEMPASEMTVEMIIETITGPKEDTAAEWEAETSEMAPETAAAEKATSETTAMAETATLTETTTAVETTATAMNATMTVAGAAAGTTMAAETTIAGSVQICYCVTSRQ